MVLKIIHIGLGSLGLGRIRKRSLIWDKPEANWKRPIPWQGIRRYPPVSTTEWDTTGSWRMVVNRSRDFDSVAYADVSEEQLKIANERFGIPQEKLFNSAEKAVGEVEADAALVSTSTQYHKAIALTAIKAGLHVLVEKPLAESMADAKEMVNEANKQRVKLMIDQNHRFNPWVQTTKKLVKEKAAGELGYVLYVEGWSGYRTETYRHRYKYPMLVNTGCHSLDQIRCMTGLDPLNVSARAWRPKWTWPSGHPGCPAITATYEMDNNVVVTYHESNVSMGKGYSRWSFECSKGEIRIEDDEVTAYLNQPSFYLKATSTLKVKPVEMMLQEKDYVLHEFANAIIQDREPETSGKDNLMTMAMMHAAMKSAEIGRLVDIEEVMDSTENWLVRQ